MEEPTYESPHLFAKDEELIQTLAPQIILIHHRQVLAEMQLIIRFANGYGVAIHPVSPAEDDQVLEMLVLRFHGPKINDYKLVQYAPIPEVTRGKGDEIRELCRQVSLFPEPRTLTLYSVPAAGRVKKGGWEKRCSNF